MKTLLYTLIEVITRAHEDIMRLNDTRAWFFSDKQLHFLVIGLIGMALVLVLQPIFTMLAESDHVIVITWLYVFTVILVLTFAIEIGQKASGSGAMEFEDIVFGVVGFLVMFAFYAVIRGMIRFVIRLIRGEE